MTRQAHTHRPTCSWQAAPRNARGGVVEVRVVDPSGSPIMSGAWTAVSLGRSESAYAPAPASAATCFAYRAEKKDGFRRPSTDNQQDIGGASLPAAGEIASDFGAMLLSAERLEEGPPS